MQPTWELLSAFLEAEALDRYEAAYRKIIEDNTAGGRR